MLQVQKITKAFAGHVLLEEVTWHVGQRDRVGLTGPNGSGKTTLLRILAGIEPPDAGKPVLPRGTAIGYLPQEGLYHRGRTLQEEALSAFRHILSLEEEARHIEEGMERLDPDSENHDSLLARYGEVQEQWQQLGGFSLEARVSEVLAGLGFSPEDLTAPTDSFSGGWQMRIALAKLLLREPNLLLLDEPTNHLDLEARNWLEDYLVGYPHAVVLVSHDRYFLDRVVTRITEIDRRRLVDYPGNYSSYIETRKKQLTVLRARAAHQQEEMERIKRFIDRFRYKATKAAQVQSRIKMLEKMELIELPPQRKTLHLRLPPPKRSGRIVLELEAVSKRYGEKQVFRRIDLLIERGDKIALVGPNGAGKSTLMRMLAAAEPPDSGRRKLGHKVETAFFSQDRLDQLEEDKTVLDNLMDSAPLSLVAQLRTILGAFLFHGDDVDKKVKVLSGGEKSRVALAKMLLQPANALLLDEPTNHLDLDSKEVLLGALETYPGTLVFVSHDRYFIDALANKIVEVGGGTVRMYWGNYEDYLRAKLEPGTPQTEGPRGVEHRAPPKAKSAGSVSKNRARKLREKLRQLETSIADTETALASLEARMAVPGFYEDAEAAQRIAKTHQELKIRLEALYAEWEGLAKKQETLAAN